jgi:hypothetical protein
MLGEVLLGLGEGGGVDAGDPLEVIHGFVDDPDMAAVEDAGGGRPAGGGAGRVDRLAGPTDRAAQGAGGAQQAAGLSQVDPPQVLHQGFGAAGGGHGLPGLTTYRLVHRSAHGKNCRRTARQRPGSRRNTALLS